MSTTPKTTCPVSDEISDIPHSLKKCTVFLHVTQLLSPRSSGADPHLSPWRIHDFPQVWVLLVAVGNQQQLRLPVTGKEAGTGIEQALIPCSTPWGPQWHACQKAKPHVTCYGAETALQMPAL